MQYSVVFDAASTGFRTWTFPAHGLIFVVIGAAFVGLVIWKGALPFPQWSSRPLASKIFAYSFFSFAVIWTVTAYISAHSEYTSLSNAQRTGAVHVAEGLVTDFTPMPATGHAMERFCVSGACFAYSDFVVTSGFNNTSSHGGPIREGLPVRVTYVGDSILKLEVAK